MSNLKGSSRPAEAPLAAPPPGFPSWLSQEVSLLDGRTVQVRAILPSDVDELRRAVERADPETLRMRFLGGRPPRSDEEFERLVCLDYDRRHAVVAFADDGRGVGIARYEALDDTDTAEIAVAVDPDWRHVGLATALVRLLGACAVHNHIRRFTAEFFADNLEVTDLLAETGKPYRSSEGDESGVVAAEVTLPDDEPDRA